MGFNLYRKQKSAVVLTCARSMAIFQGPVTALDFSLQFQIPTSSLQILPTTPRHSALLSMDISLFTQAWLCCLPESTALQDSSRPGYSCNSKK